MQRSSSSSYTSSVEGMFNSGPSTTAKSEDSTAEHGTVIDGLSQRFELLCASDDHSEEAVIQAWLVATSYGPKPSLVTLPVELLDSTHSGCKCAAPLQESMLGSEAS